MRIIGGSVLSFFGGVGGASWYSGAGGLVFYDDPQAGVLQWSDFSGDGTWAASALDLLVAQDSQIAGMMGRAKADHIPVQYGVFGGQVRTQSNLQAALLELGPLSMRWASGSGFVDPPLGIFRNGVEVGTDPTGGAASTFYPFKLVLTQERVAVILNGLERYTAVGPHEDVGGRATVGFMNSASSNPSGFASFRNLFVATGEIGYITGVPVGYYVQKGITNYVADADGLITINFGTGIPTQGTWTFFDDLNNVIGSRNAGFWGGEDFAWANRAEWGENWTGAGSV